MKNTYDKQIEILKTRFIKYVHRHPNITWDDYLARLYEKNNLEIITKMEETGGEPDLFVFNHIWHVIDGSRETPALRMNLCYDSKARLSRKKFPPESSVLEKADEIGIHVCDEYLYMTMQQIEPFDMKTSSWLFTNELFREKGGAIFGDRRYDRAFIYHNGADSYYSSRGFRGYIIIKY